MQTLHGSPVDLRERAEALLAVAHAIGEDPVRRVGRVLQVGGALRERKHRQRDRQPQCDKDALHGKSPEIASGFANVRRSHAERESVTSRPLDIDPVAGAVRHIDAIARIDSDSHAVRSVVNRHCGARRLHPRHAHLPLNGSIPLRLIAADALCDVRKAISRFADSTSFAPATTAAENTEAS